MVQKKRKTELTLAELSEYPDDHMTYRSVGLYSPLFRNYFRITSEVSRVRFFVSQNGERGELDHFWHNHYQGALWCVFVCGDTGRFWSDTNASYDPGAF